jgi:hypothetical protein
LEGLNMPKKNNNLISEELESIFNDFADKGKSYLKSKNK